MKFIVILFVCFTTAIKCLSQENEMSIETLEHLVVMNSSQFENWALKHDYEFEKIDHKYEFFDIIYYIKKGKSCIGFTISKTGENYSSVQYQTRNSVVYTRLKSECTKKGYKYIKSEPYDISNNSGVFQKDRKSTRLNSSHSDRSRMPSSA